MKAAYVNQNESGHFRHVLKLIRHLRAYWVRMALAVVFGICHQLTITAVSALGAYITGLAIMGSRAEKLRPFLIALGIAVAARVLFYYLEMWMNHDIAFKVLADLRIRLFDAIERVSPALLLNMRSGQLASTLMGDVELLEWFFAHTFGSMLVAVAAPLIMAFVLGRIHPALPLILLPFVALMILIPSFRKRKADRQGREVRDQLGDANAVTIEGIQGMKEILAMNARERYNRKNSAYMSRFYESQLKYGIRLGTEGALLQGTLGVSMLAVTALAAVYVTKGRIDPALYPFISILAGMVLGPVLDICSTARNFGLIFAAADRVYQVLEAKPTVADNGPDRKIDEISPSVSFSHVSFAYSEEAGMVLKDVSFSVQPGETVALVGHSGAGKSTCLNLLMRSWDPSEGTVAIGGIPLTEMSLQSLHSLTSVVLQDVYLFHISIRENIRLGRPGASDREVEEAARMAMAHDFITQLPQGYDTIAGEAGMRLSGGQRQRIAIARALLRKAKLLLMDEAVSSLDTENEKEIQESIRISSARQTTIIVAHRISTIRSADRIVVLKEGCVAEQGTYAELMENGGYFRQLITAGAKQT